MDERRGQAYGETTPFAGTSDGTGNGPDQPTTYDYGGNGPGGSDPTGTNTPGTANYNPNAASNGNSQPAAPPPDNSGATASNSGGADQAPSPSDDAGTTTADNAPPPSDASSGTADNSSSPSDAGATTADNSSPPNDASSNNASPNDAGPSDSGSDTADNTPPPASAGPTTADNSPPPADPGPGTTTADNSGNGAPPTGDDSSGGLIDGTAQVASGLVGDIVNTADGLVTGGVNATTGLLDNVVNTADGLVDNVVGAVGSIAGNGTGGASGLLDNVVSTADGLVTSTVNTVDGLVGDAANGGNGLLGDIVQTVDGVVTDASNAIGLNDNGNGLLGDVTGAADGIGNVAGTGGLIDDVVAVANSPLNGDISADTGPNGSSPTILANLTDDGSVGNLVNDAGNIVASTFGDTGLTDGNGPILTASVLPSGNGIVDNGVTANVNDPAQSGPIIDVDAVSDGQNGASHNLINAGALDQGGIPNVLANVLTGGDASNANITGNVIDVGPDGHTLADANVLTSPDQFQFTSLNGTGADSLVGSLTDPAGSTAGTGLPAVAAPSLDLGGDHPVIDVSLNGDADADHGNILAPLQQAHPLGIV